MHEKTRDHDVMGYSPTEAAGACGFDAAATHRVDFERERERCERLMAEVLRRQRT
jgi:hypothetical protein